MRVRKNVFVLIIWKNSEMFIQKHNKNNKQLTLRHKHNQLKQQMKKSSHSFTYLIHLLKWYIIELQFPLLCSFTNI